MRIKKQFRNLKAGAKKVFVGMLILSLLSTATGIGSVFVYADEHDHVYGVTADSNGDGTHTYHCEVEGCEEEKTEDCSFGDDGKCPVCGYENPDEPEETGSEEHEHSYGEWVYDGGDLHYRECECGDKEVQNCNFDSYLTNYNGTHLKRCSTCGNSADEDCTFGEPVVSDDGTQVTVTCIHCGYSETRENTDADVAEEVEEETDIQKDSSSSTEGAPYQFDDFFTSANKIEAATGLKYDGTEKDLLVNAVSSVSKDILPGITSITEISYSTIYSWGDASYEGHKGTGAGRYTVSFGLTYVYKESETAEEQTHQCSRTVEVEIAPITVDDITVKPDESNYLLIPKEYSGEPFCKLYVGDTEIPNSVYHFKETTDTPRPCKAGDTITFAIDSNDENHNYSFHVEKTIQVEPVELTFNGSTELKPAYRGSVEIAPPSGYTIGWTRFALQDTLKYTTLGTHDLTVYIKNTETEKYISQEFQIYITDEEIADDFITSYPEFEDEVTLTGSTIDLMKKAPVLNSEYIEEKDYYNVTYGFVNSDSGEPVYGKSPQATDKGVYSYEFIIVVTRNSGDTPVIYNTGYTYTTGVLKSLTSSDITFTAQADDYQSLDPSIAVEDFYLVKDKGNILQKDTHYTASVGNAGPYETGTQIEIEYNGIADNDGSHGAYYKDSVKKTVSVSAIDVLINGEQQKEKYDDAIKITAEGYTISDTADGVFNTEFEYNTPCSDKTLTLYFQKEGTSRIVMQKVTGLNIGGAADVVVLYDGEEELKPYYYDTVRISAKGFTVSISKNGPFNGAYALDYDESKNMQPVDEFTLYFKDSNTGMVYEKNIKGVNLYESPEIDILYNGEDLQDWYSDDVTITADGYTVSDFETSGFAKSYKMTGTGTVSKKLYFKNDAGTKDYMIVVAIDRTAPTGSITLGKKTSNKFNTKDEIIDYYNTIKSATVTSSDDLSGVDYVRYYVNDTFYSSAEDVISAIAEKSGMWRNYSSSSKPTLVKNKNNYIYVLIYDKAGNKGAISIGNIVCDTVVPKMVTVRVTPGSDEGSTNVDVAGKDTFSGVNRFKLIYREKKEGKNDPPSKQEVFDNGEYIGATEESQGASAARYTLKDIDPEKTYLFYLVAVDRAGNISEVMTREIEGEDVTPQEEEEEKSTGGNSGSSGLTPAPSGIAGSGSGSGGAGSSGGSGSSAGGTEGGAGGSGSSAGGQTGGGGGTGTGSDQGTGENVINREPYIAEATGSTKIGEIETSGWTKISDEVKKADKGALVEVEMSGMPTVSKQLFDSMKDKDVQVNLRMAGDLEWQIKGNNLSQVVGDMDMGVRMGSRNIPAGVLSDVTGSYPHVEFSGNHQGDLGFEATIAVPVGDTNAGMVATLYSYDPDTKELVASGNVTVDERGYAKFPVTKSGDCTVVITPEGVLAPAEAARISTGSLTQEEETGVTYPETSRIRLSDIFTLRGNANAWLFVVAILSAGICVLILLLPSLQLQNRDDMGDNF